MSANRTMTFFLAVTIAVTILCQTGGTPRPGSVAQVAAAGEPATYKAAYFYTTDQATATGYESWLESNDFEVDVFKAQYYTVYLPLVMRNYVVSVSSRGHVASSPVVRLSTLPDLSTYDLILIGPDTGSGGTWHGGSVLAAAIDDTLRPVVALGAGGHAFLGQFGLDIGYPQGSETTTQSAQVADLAQTAPIWDGTRPVTRTADVANLYTAGVSTVVIPLSEHLPDGMRVASLPGDDTHFPIVIQAERFILWGFGGAAGDLTDAGRNLFLNLLDFGEEDVLVPLQSRQFTPSQGVEEAFATALSGATEPLHAIVQLRRPINPTDQETLESKGVTLISYLSGLNYLALVDQATNLDDPELLALVRWIGEYRPEDRVHPDVIGGAFQAHNIGANGMVALTVMFFPEVNEAEVMAVVEAHGLIILRPMALNAWAVTMDESGITPLSQEECVRRIEQGPVPDLDVNDGARAAMGTDAVVDWDTATGTARGLDGSGVRAAVMEGGVDYRHDDFGTRFVYTYTSGYSDHATHVAGIVGGDGARSVAEGGTAYQWRGHAPAVTLMSVPYGHDTTANYYTAINLNGADLSNHSYVMSYAVYDTEAAGVDSIVRGDATHSGNSIPARLAVWAACNQGLFAQYNNEEGFFSIYSPAKNALSVGSTDSNSDDISYFSSRGPTFDNRLKPDVMAPGCEMGGNEIWSTSTSNFNGYTDKCGTSMSAPATVGALSLALEKYFALYDTTTPPRPSSLKGLAIHTATDLQRDFTTGGQFWNCPDLCQANQASDLTTPVSPTCAVLYHAGPDYSTGYGLINVPALVEQVQHRGFVESSVDPTDTVDTYSVTVLENRPEIKFTLVWDDEPGDTATAETTSKLVNDLDLTLTAPDSTVYHPWILDPLTPNANPGSGGFDSVTRADITAAYRGVDRRNNVEQVTVTGTVGIMTGTWTVRVTAHNLPNGNAQPYSLLGDFRQINIVGAQSLVSTGFPVSAGPTANPDKVLLRVKIENPHVTPGHTENYTTTDFLVDVGDPGGGIAWQSADVLSVFQVGGEVAIDIRPPAGMDAGQYYDLRVTLVGIDDDTRTNALYFIEADEVAGYFLTDTSGSMDGGKIEAAREAGKALVDLLRVDDWVGVGRFEDQDHHLMDVTQVVDDSQLNTAKGHISTFIADGATAMGPGMDLAREKLNAAALPADTQKIVYLLSDGMENTAEPYGAFPPTVGCWDDHPDWDCNSNPPYVKTTWPADIQAYVVCLGEAGAAWHTFCDQVAADTSGPPVWHVYETPVGSSTSALAGLEMARSAFAPESQVAFPAMGLAGILDYPTTLEVRLDDTYLDMGQMSHRWPRMLEWTGWISPQLEYVEVPIDVEEHLPAIYVTLEWDDPAASVNGDLKRPDDSIVDPADPDVLYYREDATHIHWGIKEPEADTWKVGLIAYKSLAEYLVTASGPSDIGMRLLIDPDDQFVYEEIEICALLTDNKPIPASSPAAVWANVIDPAGVAHWMVLYDDGYHEDGGANDGVFCERYPGVDLPGVYQIKAIGWGYANDGRYFVRRAMGHTTRKPKVLYVYEDEGIAREYQELFALNTIQVDLVPVGELKPGSPDLSQYALIVIGPATGDASDWGTPDALDALVENRRPTLGLGEGGYAFYGQLNLYIGYPYGAHGEERDVYAVDMAHVVWQIPHDLKLDKPEVNLYKATNHVSIYVEETPWGVELLGHEVGSRYYYPLIRQVTWQWDEPWNHCLWGYGAGPSSMTDQGVRLFFNTAWYMMH